jgi:hypothetical protein
VACDRCTTTAKLTALTRIAERLGYDTDAVRCAFRARFWRDTPTRKPSRRDTAGDELELSR